MYAPWSRHASVEISEKQALRPENRKENALSFQANHSNPKARQKWHNKTNNCPHSCHSRSLSLVFYLFF
jgi:hypothetical protein